MMLWCSSYCFEIALTISINPHERWLVDHRPDQLLREQLEELQCLSIMRLAS